MGYEPRTTDASPSSANTIRRLAWIACGALAIWVGFAIGRSEKNVSNAAPAVGDGPQPTVVASSVPVIVELFTSQGCSSCPPADRLLAELARDQPVPGALIVPMSEHVDYWNRLGWPDPFSKAQFSDRQRIYARAAGSRRIYTPQMVVDGRYGFVGSQRKEALANIAKASMATHAVVDLDPCDDMTDASVLCSAVEIRDVPEITEGDTTLAVYAVTELDLEVDVPRGENAGRELSHVAVVREMAELGVVENGTFRDRVSTRIEEGWKRENLRLVVFVQERASRRILGAGIAAPGSSF
ncbi:MAG: DUF1223 domain-containing protein [Thermoanaerobaculia bacterium]|nr:DUF1223 domain-containing protein [Thermoanaerobaculia bacterium]